MFDFRYHALSLVAVFVALLLGLLLGVAIGDKGLVSSAENKVKDSLRADVRAEQKKAADLQSRLDQRETFENEVYPLLVNGQLDGKRIGVVFLGGSSGAKSAEVRKALEGSGAEITGIVGIREPLQATEIAKRATGTRYAGLDQGTDLYEPYGVRIGRQLVQGGKLLKSTGRPLFEKLAGQPGPFDAIVVVRNPPDDVPDDQKQPLADFENGLMKGLTASDVPVVGIADSSSGGDQIPWYRDRGLSSVDNIDDMAGRAALTFVLTGANEGAYGFDAPRLLPDIAGGVG